MTNLSKGLVRPSLKLPTQLASHNLTMAELGLQRGDVEQARGLLERRIAQGANDFKTMNLYGVALAHAHKFDNAITLFARLRAMARNTGHRTKATFNLGQALFFKDLMVEGDTSVIASLFSKPGQTVLPLSRPQPYQRCIEVWDDLLRHRGKHLDIVHTYLGFTCQQLGFLDHALGHIAAALSQNEGLYITHYVLGRLFMDLFVLDLEGNRHSLAKQTATFFEIEAVEIVGEEGIDRVLINRETLLDIAIQSYQDARNLSPLSVSVYLGQCQVYLYAGLFDEAHEALAHAEILAPNSLSVLEASLKFHEAVRSKTEIIRTLLERIKLARRNTSADIYHILPSFYML